MRWPNPHPPILIGAVIAWNAGMRVGIAIGGEDGTGAIEIATTVAPTGMMMAQEDPKGGGMVTARASGSGAAIRDSGCDAALTSPCEPASMQP